MRFALAMVQIAQNISRSMKIIFSKRKMKHFVVCSIIIVLGKWMEGARGENPIQSLQKVLPSFHFELDLI